MTTSGQDKTTKRSIGGWLFLLIMLLLYGVLALFDIELTRVAMADFVKLLEKVLPALLIVFILMFVINLLLQPAWIKKYLGRCSGIKGWLTAIAGGILSTGPIYPWYALLHELRQQGMTTALLAVFLNSRAIKLPLLPLLVHYFGAVYTLVLVFYLLVFAVISGLVMERVKGLPGDTD